MSRRDHIQIFLYFYKHKNKFLIRTQNPEARKYG